MAADVCWPEFARLSRADVCRCELNVDVRPADADFVWQIATCEDELLSMQRFACALQSLVSGPLQMWP